MNLADVKLAYRLSCVMIGLIILSPTLLSIVSFPEGERFSELYLLDSDRMLENLPFNVSSSSAHTVCLGVGNNMGSLESYLVYVKLGNQTEPLPDSDDELPSSLEPVFEYRLLLGDGEVRERMVTFSFEDVSFEGEVCSVSSFSVDAYDVNVKKVAVYDDEKAGFVFQLFFELWIYDAASLNFVFHDRFVGLLLNLNA